MWIHSKTNVIMQQNISCLSHKSNQGICYILPIKRSRIVIESIAIDNMTGLFGSTHFSLSNDTV